MHAISMCMYAQTWESINNDGLQGSYMYYMCICANLDIYTTRGDVYMQSHVYMYMYKFIHLFNYLGMHIEYTSPANFNPKKKDN